MIESLMNNKSFDNKRIAEGYAKRSWLHKRIIMELKTVIESEFKNGLDVGCFLNRHGVKRFGCKRIFHH